MTPIFDNHKFASYLSSKSTSIANEYYKGILSEGISYISRKSGVSEIMIVDIIKNKITPDVESFYRICQFFKQPTEPFARIVYN